MVDGSIGLDGHHVLSRAEHVQNVYVLSSTLMQNTYTCLHVTRRML